jgi:nucleoside recognition membrane protein YjiH
MISLRFILPSLLGVLIFLTPIPFDGQLTIVINILTSAAKLQLGDYSLSIVVSIITIGSALTLVGSVFDARWIHRRPLLEELFNVSVIWLSLRLIGAGLGLLYLFQAGPALLISEQIGGAVFVGIGVNVLPIFVIACLLLPLLTDYGFMEFGGTLARPFFRKFFGLPGRSAIDAVTSFIGASSIGMLITIRQYEQGNYTAREACVIITNFSVVSIPFCLVVASVSGIEQLFIPWYATVVVTCIFAALITPRLPPLSRLPDSYAVELPSHGAAEPESESSLLHEAWQNALARAESAPGPREYLAIAFTNMLFLLFSVMAATMALATLAALIVFHTPLFTWLSYPLVGLLEMASLPSAQAAAPALFSGFLDQYMPAITAKGIDSQVTSFVLAGLSVCQLIFMSEAGVIILRSSLPLRLPDLILIFLLRTLIVLPVLILGAHLLV